MNAWKKAALLQSEHNNIENRDIRLKNTIHTRDVFSASYTPRQKMDLNAFAAEAENSAKHF